MANSPLELYQQAYKLHYIERKIPDACKIYERLISEFPDSDACSYASIQLEKIKAGRATRELEHPGATKGPSVSFLLTAVMLLTLFLTILDRGELH